MTTRARSIVASKYRNVRTEVDGIKFASKAEARRWAELNLLLRARAIANLRRQERFNLDVGGHHVCVYVADFTYNDCANHGCYTVEDVKGGPATDTYRLKKELMLAIHGIEIKEIRYGRR